MHFKSVLIATPLRRLRQFQFPPSGKVHFKLTALFFRWEGLKFQFPPSGKVHFKLLLSTVAVAAAPVSIPSERESAFQGQPSDLTRYLLSVSIPSERESAFQETKIAYTAEDETGAFQFPPSGKVHFKLTNPTADPDIRILKFQFPSERESAFQGTAVATDDKIMLVGFNSLRAGKCISRYPFFDPDEPWLQIPQNHTRTARRIFFATIYPTTPRNPDEYWNGRDFLSKVPRKSGVACVLGQF